MKIAYCIIAHKYTVPLKTTVDILSKSNDIYIHVDLKSNINDFSGIFNKATFIKDRIDVKWGAFSQVEATLKLLDETKIKEYDYIFLLSGDCMPLKSDDMIKEILEKNDRAQYVSNDLSTSQDNIDKRVLYKYRGLNYKKNKNVGEKIIEKIQFTFKLFKKNELFGKLPKLYKGSQWFGITVELRDYIMNYLRDNPWYSEAFKYSYCSDEVFFHTIIFNSKYSKKIYKPEKQFLESCSSLRFIDWSSGPELPKILREDDFDRMKKTGCLFARKFDDSIDVDLFYKTFIN